MSLSPPFVFVEEPAFVLIWKTVDTRLLDPCRAELCSCVCVCCGNLLTYLYFLKGRGGEKTPFPGNFGRAGRDAEECQTKRERLAAWGRGGTLDFDHPCHFPQQTQQPAGVETTALTCCLCLLWPLKGKPVFSRDLGIWSKSLLHFSFCFFSWNSFLSFSWCE